MRGWIRGRDRWSGRWKNGSGRDKGRRSAEAEIAIMELACLCSSMHTFETSAGMSSKENAWFQYGAFVLLFVKVFACFSLSNSTNAKYSPDLGRSFASLSFKVMQRTTVKGCRLCSWFKGTDGVQTSRRVCCQSWNIASSGARM